MWLFLLKIIELIINELGYLFKIILLVLKKILINYLFLMKIKTQTK